MKLLHLADLHGNRERADELLQSLAVAYRSAQGVDLVAIAGDIWDSVIQNTAGSRFVEIVEAIRRLADVAPVVMIYGTPTHDADGSLDVFRTLTSRFGITILEPGKAYFLHAAKVYMDRPNGAKAILFGVPEPSKKWLAPYFDSRDQVEQAVRDGLRGLFAGLGAIRRQYPDLPCVMLYHGQVGGARLQTGDVLDNGSGIRPSVDDLAAVGADYIALGDIHEPQQVGTLPAYYPGSVYPVNFGETHEAGGNLVEIVAGGIPTVNDHRFYSEVTRVPFGHPVNRKLTSRYPAQPDPKTFQPGARTWVEITCTKEESVSLDPEAMTTKLLTLGAAPGSRVTLNVLPSETVRAGEITAKTQLRDKVTLWGENSSKVIPEGVLTKADDVQAEAAATGAVGRGDRIRLNRLVLRGAIGLWKKSNLDEVDVNLDDIDEGLVALIGPNGSGKTSLLENMHPWPALLTRDGTLKDHFRLRDSFRDLYWTDTATGSKYRALIQINAAVASGATEYYLWKDGVPLPGIEGRKDGYVEAVNRIFGSQDLYLRSAFVTQRQPKGLSDLADATPKERKVLFSALCGLEYFEAYKALAKAKGDAVEAQAATKTTEINVMASRLPDPEELRDEIDRGLEDMEDAKGELNVLTELGKDKAKALEDAQAKAVTNRERSRQAAEAGLLVREANSKITAATSTAAEARKVLDGVAAAEGVIAEHADLTGRLETQRKAFDVHRQQLDAERAEVDLLRAQHEEANRKVRAEHDAKVQAYADAESEARDAEFMAERELHQAKTKRDTLQSKVLEFEAAIAAPVADHCPACRQMLPDDAKAHVLEARAKLEADLAKVRALLEEVKQDILSREVTLRTAEVARLNLRSSAPAVLLLPTFVPPPSRVPAFDESLLRGLKDSLEWLDVERARQILTAAAGAQVRLEELAKQVAELQATVARELAREAELRAQLDDSLEATVAELQTEHRNLQERYREAQGRGARAEADLAAADRRLKDYERDVVAVEALRADLAKLQAEVAEWRLLELACSDKGIQALELDAVAPSIAAIANGLLRDAFGSRYQVEFSTTRMSAGSAKTQRQIEDLLINVMDAETGLSQEISTLSGGEAVWIRRALYDAFGLIRARSTGLNFLTVFQDEADGQLDPVARLTYLRMLASAHAQAGRAHTIIITHSTELQELIPARVEVCKLKGRPAAQAAA